MNNLLDHFLNNIGILDPYKILYVLLLLFLENIIISEIYIHSRSILKNIIKFKRQHKTKNCTLITPNYEFFTKDITNNSSYTSEKRKVSINMSVIYL